MCTDKYGLSLQTSFILESVCNYDDIRCQVMERGGLQFLIAATKETPISRSASVSLIYSQAVVLVHVFINNTGRLLKFTSWGMCVWLVHTHSHKHTHRWMWHCICISETRFWHFSVLNMQYLCTFHQHGFFCFLWNLHKIMYMYLHWEKNTESHLFFMRLLHLSDC